MNSIFKLKGFFLENNNDSQQALFAGARFVMVQTSHSGNIGAAARAIKTMGFSQLVLVQPKQFPCEQAEAMASSAKDVLEQVLVVDSLQQALAPCHWVMGASARIRSMPWPLLSARDGCVQAAQQLMTKPNEGQIALVFGRESSGLTNEELALCNAHINIDANPNYSSLNVASAIQVLAYELRVALLQTPTLELPMQLADHAQHEQFFDQLQQTLINIDFLNADNPRLLMQKLRRLFFKAQLEPAEMNILRGILAKIEQKQKR